MHLVAYFGLKDIMMGLLEIGKVTDLKDSYGQTPLSRAARRGNEGVVRLLLEAKADIEAKDNYGKTALYEAVDNGHEEVVMLLVEKGANIEAITNHGFTRCFRRSKASTRQSCGCYLRKVLAWMRSC
jgi:ankyrin repeat protein